MGKSKRKESDNLKVDIGASSPMSTSIAGEASQPAQSLHIPAIIHPRSYEQATSSVAQCASSSEHLATIVSRVTPLPPAASSAQATPSTIGASLPPSIPEQLWDRAYDNLQNDKPKFVEAYENILSHELNGSTSTSLSFNGQRNIIEQANQERRRLQMSKLIQIGLKKTEKEAKVKQGIGNAMQVILAAKDIIGSAVQACPQAALAWTGVSLALQVNLLLGKHNDRS